jgi:polyhydroxybutyrate depolymerase
MSVPTLLLVAALISLQPEREQLGAGEHSRQLTVGDLKRSYYFHVPASYDPRKPMPVVLVLHGAVMNGPIMEWFCGMSKKADEAGFIAVYPNGTGPGGTLLTWNAGVFPGGLNPRRADDVKFIRMVLDDLAGLVSVDPKRVYASGMSNGGMMAYRLAAEMPERIAAVAVVCGVLCTEDTEPKCPVPVLHFHGTKDSLIPFDGTKSGSGPYRFPSVMENLQTWCKVNGCAEVPRERELPTKEDKLKVVCKDFCTGKEKAPVILYMIEGGGHTWPGMHRHAAFLGATTDNISANDLIWDFFRQFTLRETTAKPQGESSSPGDRRAKPQGNPEGFRPGGFRLNPTSPSACGSPRIDSCCHAGPPPPRDGIAR